MDIMQGDDYTFNIDLDTIDGRDVNGATVSKLEVMIDSLRKSYPESIKYDTVTNVFVIHLSQDDTFSLRPGKKLFQIRIKFKDGCVSGFKNLEEINVISSHSKLIL